MKVILSNLYQIFRESRLRQILWPVRSYELAKFFPMALLMFTVLLNQNIVRSIKDSLVMTYIGPEVISFIKLWGEAPAGIIFVLIYTKMCNRMSTERVFRYIVCSFLICFAIFTFIIFPNRDFFHPDPRNVEFFSIQYPHFKWFIFLWGKWSFCLLYILGELWPTVVFSLLYWQLANKITSTEEAGRFYSFLSLFGQTNLLVSGSLIVYFAQPIHCFSHYFACVGDTTQIMLNSLMNIVMLSGVVCLAIHRWIELKIIIPHKKLVKDSTKVLKLNLKDSFKLIMRSRYLWLMCTLLISYSLTINLIEGLWMSKVRELYPEAHQFISYHGNVLFWTGVFTLLCSFLGSSVIRYFGWFWGAGATPIMIMIVGGIFFTAVLFQDRLENLYGMLSLPSVVWIGGLQHVLGKGTKYSLFDATKEMAYIPLDDEMKTKGKAAVDVVGTKIGKASGAVLQFAIFTLFPTARYDDIVSFLMSIFFIICALWIYCVYTLSNTYQALQEGT
jgi:AAA family ATP:ADP antiporter